MIWGLPIYTTIFWAIFWLTGYAMVTFSAIRVLANYLIWHIFASFRSGICSLTDLYSCGMTPLPAELPTFEARNAIPFPGDWRWRFCCKDHAVLCRDAKAVTSFGVLWRFSLVMGRCGVLNLWFACCVLQVLLRVSEHLIERYQWKWNAAGWVPMIKTSRRPKHAHRFSVIFSYIGRQPKKEYAPLWHPLIRNVPMVGWRYTFHTQDIPMKLISTQDCSAPGWGLMIIFAEGLALLSISNQPESAKIYQSFSVLKPPHSLGARVWHFQTHLTISDYQIVGYIPIIINPYPTVFSLYSNSSWGLYIPPFSVVQSHHSSCPYAISGDCPGTKKPRGVRRLRCLRVGCCGTVSSTGRRDFQLGILQILRFEIGSTMFNITVEYFWYFLVGWWLKPPKERWWSLQWCKGVTRVLILWLRLWPNCWERGKGKITFGRGCPEILGHVQLVVIPRWAGMCLKNGCINMGP